MPESSWLACLGFCSPLSEKLILSCHMCEHEKMYLTCLVTTQIHLCSLIRVYCVFICLCKDPKFFSSRQQRLISLLIHINRFMSSLGAHLKVHDHNCINSIQKCYKNITVITLSIGTDRPLQMVWTQIRCRILHCLQYIQQLFRQIHQ